MDEYTPRPPRPRAPDSSPPKLPCRATIRSYVPADATGELVTDDGELVRFGATACKGFTPTAGMVVWLVAVVAHPLRTGYRASVINVTGELENTRLEDARQAIRQERREQEREHKLLLAHRLIDIDIDDDDDSGRYHWTKLLARSSADRRSLATDLVKLKRTSHLFEDLFEDLVTIDAEAFHPHLAALDWRTDPESLAWTRAPFAAVAFAQDVLAPGLGGGVQARTDAEELSDAELAALVLARSAAPEGIRLLSRWVSTSGIPEDDLDNLLLETGWQLHDGRLVQLWGHRPAFCVRRSTAGSVHLFEASARRCTICGDPLLCLLRDAADQDAADQIVPFPIFTCVRCVAWEVDRYYVEVDAAGTPTPRVVAERGNDALTVGPLGLPAAVAVEFEPAPWAVPTDIRDFERVTRLGGWPSWIQSPDSAGACPTCDRPMEFLAQFPDPAPDLWNGERWSGGEDGLIYVFVCRGCRMAASFHEQC